MIDPEADATKKLAALINEKQKEFEPEPSEIQAMQDIEPQDIRVETALMVDGLDLLKLGLNDLPRMNRCPPKITCSDENSWSHGSTAINSMKMVSNGEK